MLIQFDSERIVIDGQGLLYDPYYFALAGEDAGTTWADVVVTVMAQWAEALRQLESGSALLPFGIYDQCIECLEAKALAENIVLRCVWLDVEGYGIGLLNLPPLMSESHSIIKSSPHDFGIFNCSELITALKRPEAIDDARVKGELTQ